MTPEQKKIIERSREFAERVIIDGKIQNSIEEYCIFCIGRFMLAKELFFKKNHETRTVTFNCKDNASMVREILNIGRFVEENNDSLETNVRGIDLKYNTVDIQIIPESERTDKLVKALWIVNKIRDSIAHGKYDIDFENKQIIIDNDVRNEGYSLVCKVPITMLNNLLNPVENNQLRTEVYYTNNLKEHEIKPKENSSITEEYVNDIQTKARIYLSVQTLTQYFKKIMTSSSIDLNTKEVLLGQIYGIIYGSENTEDYALMLEKMIDKLGIKNIDDIEKYERESMEYIISEMAELLKKNSGEKNISDELIAMHNYLQNLFAFSHIEGQEMNDRLYLVDIGKISIRYIKNQSFDNNRAAIRRRVEEYIDTISKYLENISHTGQLKPMRNETIDFYECIIKLLNERNHLILSSIRNGVEHSLISETKEELVLKDSTNPADIQDTKFICRGSYDMFYNLATSIERVRDLQEYELEEEKEKFTSKSLVETLIQVTGDNDLGLKLSNCLVAFYGLMHRNMQSISIQDLLEGYRTDKALELKTLLEYRQLQQSGLVM